LNVFYFNQLENLINRPMNFTKYLSVLFLSVALLGSCTSENKEVVQVKQPEAKRVMEPFRYHKAIEVKPGLTLDVLSWGRGSNSVGGYLILRSDSTHLNYRSVSDELDGKIVDVWDMDMDSDGNPELYIQAEGEGEGSYLNMYIYEYSENGSNQRIRFPGLSSSSKKGYKGRDSVYVKEDRIMREFPVFTSEDSTATASSKRKLEYSLKNNSLQVREIKEDNDKKDE
jgi:hypothetical protein